MPQGFRILLAAQAKPLEEIDGPGPVGPTSAGWGVTKKRRPISKIACNSCRAKKIACDGVQPVCSPCANKVAKCVFRPPDANAALKKMLAERDRDASALVEHLKSLADGEALDFLHKLKSAPDLNTALSSVRCPTGNSGARPEPPAVETISPPVSPGASPSASPPAQWHIESELSVLHPAVYPPLSPVTPGSPAVYGDSCGDPTGHFDGDYLAHHYLSVPNAQFGSNGLYCDARLERLEIGYWTRVPISNALAASVLSLYLTRDHPVLPLFDTELFLADLVEQKTNFCSAFLVSSLLCLACQAYSVTYPETWTLAAALSDEAERLWRAEQSSDSIVTVAACLCLRGVYALRGQDVLCQELALTGRKMAERLHLFGVNPDAPAAAALGAKSAEWTRFAAHVAWGAYNWLTLAALNYLDQPIVYPPNFPIPGDAVGAAHSPASTRDINGQPVPPLDYLPPYMARTFPEACRFFTICQGLANAYFGQCQSPLGPVALAFAEAKYRELLAWSDGLPREMLRGGHSHPHAWILHTWFHCAVLGLFRPFLSDHGAQTLLRSFSSPDGCPQSIFAASLKQLQHLTLTYCLAQPRLTHSPYIGSSLMQALVPMLKEPGSQDWRFYLTVFLRFCEDLYVGHPLYAELAQAALSIAMRHGLMTGAEARDRMTGFWQPRCHHQGSPIQTSISTLVVDFDMALTDVHASRISNVAREFQFLIMFDELTANQDFEQLNWAEAQPAFQDFS
ncbi:hypothetical protein HIM_06656 [Hirsutella minnesotensis 3608]|uniref:Zn(2)-C6 fungal-type domain-containing protein n=1 Tax=Hirsutella minnesotensis 3608 TaxID=1043627 RepID=A0A0F7ZTZ8_9HYPO|nr:hypothetical protein HIM_06656 [Hirsutella minnesotensis 3608]